MYVQGTLIQMCGYSTYQGCTLRVHLAKCAVKVHIVDIDIDIDIDSLGAIDTLSIK